MSTDTLGVLLGDDLEIRVQMRWAIRLAEIRAMDLLVFRRVDAPDTGSTEISLREIGEESDDQVNRQVAALIDASPNLRAGERTESPGSESPSRAPHVIQVRLKAIRCANLSSLRAQLLAEIAEEKLKLFTLSRREMTTADPELLKERRLFLRYVRCEVVYCFGLDEATDLTQVLVAVASGPHGESAVRLGHDLASGSAGSMTAVRVNPTVGPDAVPVGRRRLETILQKCLGRNLDAIERRVVVDDQVHRGIRRVWEERKSELVVMGASRHGILGGEFGRGVYARLLKGDPDPVVAITSAASPIRSRALGFLEGNIERLVPQIDREHRVSLVDRVQSNSRWDFDFFALIALSTTIAAIGLIEDSAAVVIGAMLVAPLMTPLLGLGVALVQGNPVLARISARAVILGLLVALAVGGAVGILTPGFAEPTREMLARGGPGVLDLIVAFASGLAAAYASARPGLLAALPGVAIAAALVPPIATSGLALSIGNVDLAFDALLLFSINMLTIVLASMLSLWAVGLRNIKRVSRWRMVVGGAFLVAVVVLGVSVSVKPDVEATREGVPDDLASSISTMLGDDYEMVGLAVAYDELGSQLNVRVAGETLAPQVLADEIRSLVRNRFEKPVRVRLLAQVAYRGVESEEDVEIQAAPPDAQPDKPHSADEIERRGGG